MGIASRKTALERLTAVLALAALLGATSVTAAAMTEQEFLAQYVPAVEKLERAYQHLTLEGTVTRSNIVSARPVEPLQRLLVRSDGDKLRIDRFVPEVAGGETVRVTVNSPTGSFSVRRAPGADNFVLSRLTSDSDELRSQFYYAFAPFCESGGVLLPNKFRAKNLRITSIEEENRDGEELVRVSYERDVGYGGKRITYQGYDLFSKTLGWALREQGTGKQGHATIEYAGFVDGTPRLKSAEYWRQNGDERTNVLRFEVTKFEPTTAPPETFELTTLVGDVGQERQSTTWLLLVVGGVALVAIAIVLARVAAHRAAK